MNTKISTKPKSPQAVSRPRSIAGASGQFSDIYMRPNLTNGNTVPASGSLSACPDIWPSATTPIGNFQSTLATADSYAAQSPFDIVLQEDNYIYVRGFNASPNTTSMNVSLYYAASALIQHPSSWENNPLLTDQGNNTAQINNLATQTVGVADQTFVWPSVQNPPNGSDHYCLIAQFNDANNSNPVPDPSTQFDMAQLITNNLGWGWHNISLVQAPAGISFTFQTGLSVPSTFRPSNYNILVKPVGYTGWYISYQCSQADSNGNAISMPESLITQNGGQLGGPSVFLQPGYNALLTVTMYNPNNVTAQPGANVPISMNYPASSEQEYERAKEMGLIDWQATEFVRRMYPHGLHADDEKVIPIGMIPLGDVTGKNTNT